jgi:hypothetical protein
VTGVQTCALPISERQALTDAKGVISDLQNSLIAPP